MQLLRVEETSREGAGPLPALLLETTDSYLQKRGVSVWREQICWLIQQPGLDVHIMKRS